ncbi:MAG: hypothetical protein HFJ45_08020 [Clostridia bacterium]|nr:hypothetical protein [Clostridia bacterium]
MEFNSIAGTSSGSIVATLLACGYSADEMYEFFKMYSKNINYIDFKNVLKVILGVIFKRKLIIDGLNSGEKIEKYMDEAVSRLKISNISEVKKELLIPAVDIETGKVFVFNSCKIDIENSEEKYISKVNLGRAVRASCTYPLIFSPCPYFETDTGKYYKDKCKNLKCIIERFKKEKRGKRLLLDGGIKENLAWKELDRIGCNKIVSINFSDNKERSCCKNMIEIGIKSFELVREELNRYELQDIDFLYTITLKNFSLLETDKVNEIYMAGYNQTKIEMKKIKEYLKN